MSNIKYSISEILEVLPPYAWKQKAIEAHKSSLTTDRRRFSKKETLSRILAVAFSWEKSKEGHDFWKAIHDEMNRINVKISDFLPVKNAEKDKSNKPSFLEIEPSFVLGMAQRMNSNKINFGGKYENFNYQQDIDIKDLIDATERHFLDLKGIVLNGFPLINQEESVQNHVFAIACNMMMINYQLEKDKK